MAWVAHAGSGAATSLSLHPVPILGLLVAAGLYVRAVRVLRGRGRTVGGGQQACFWFGLALVAVAVVSPLDGLGACCSLSAHMAQHLLMADIAGPFLLAGVRAPLLYFIWPRQVLVPVARARPLRTLWRVLSRPVPALATWLVVLYAWHVPVAYEAALRSEAVHGLEHLTFALAGMLAWWPLLDPTHHRTEGRIWKSLYVIAARTIGGVLGIVLIVSSTQLYPFYGNEPMHVLGISPRTDQQLAGAMMMMVDFAIICIGFVYFLLRLPDDGAGTRAPDGAPSRA